ncbi:MAG: family 16 glycosylhydrolase, partial [Candidatus Margulisiibacteriota bacterium]
ENTTAASADHPQTSGVSGEVTTADQSKWEKRSGRNDDAIFGSTFDPSMVGLSGNGHVTLTLNNDVSGELRTTERYSYGTITARMKIGGNPAVINGFFTYTGQWDGNPHNEIDFEFVGKDTGSVQTNYYLNSDNATVNARTITLGFDASKDYHNYTIEWSTPGIKWSVDGKVIRSAAESPKVTQQIMANIWRTTNGWGGHFVDPGHPINTEFQYIKYTPYKGSAASNGPRSLMPKPAPATRSMAAPAAISVSGKRLSGLKGIAFNGAEGGKSGSSVSFKGKGFDMGMVLFEEVSLKNNFSFSYSGSGPFKIVFIRGEQNIGVVQINDAETGRSKVKTLQVPSGTDKINVMASSSEADVVLKDFSTN